jgi:hypothetical protein
MWAAKGFDMHMCFDGESPWIALKWRVVARAPKWRAKVERYRPSFLFYVLIK